MYLAEDSLQHPKIEDYLLVVFSFASFVFEGKSFSPFVVNVGSIIPFLHLKEDHEQSASSFSSLLVSVGGVLSLMRVLRFGLKFILHKVFKKKSDQNGDLSLSDDPMTEYHPPRFLLL